MAAQQQSFDFIVVGSGAGGGVLAARLARNDKGLRVLLIDAGSDPRDNMHYRVPGFHALATEDPKLRWDYFVEHLSDPDLAAKDEKYAAGKGIFYPRASAIGGCTAHHAMITVYPDPSDWDDIADLTADEIMAQRKDVGIFRQMRGAEGSDGSESKPPGSTPCCARPRTRRSTRYSLQRSIRRIAPRVPKSVLDLKIFSTPRMNRYLIPTIRLRPRK